jgi:hypothetical protein
VASVAGGVGDVNGVDISTLELLAGLREGVSGGSKMSPVLPGDDALDTVPGVNDSEGHDQCEEGEKLKLIPVASELRIGVFRSSKACLVGV